MQVMTEVKKPKKNQKGGGGMNILSSSPGVIVKRVPKKEFQEWASRALGGKKGCKKGKLGGKIASFPFVK